MSTSLFIHGGLMSSEFKIKGKLKSLLEEYKKVEPSADISELEAGISLLDTYNWNPVAVALWLKVDNMPEFTNLESSYYHKLLRAAVEKEGVVSISENEQLDRIVDYSRIMDSSGGHVTSLKTERLENIVAKLKYDI